MGAQHDSTDRRVPPPSFNVMPSMPDYLAPMDHDAFAAAVEQAINEVLEQRVADRCAPLVEFVTYVARVWEGAHLGHAARAALRAHREREGGVDG